MRTPYFSSVLIPEGPRTIVQPIDDALWVPAGMAAADRRIAPVVSPADASYLADEIRRLIARGIPAGRARAVVVRAFARARAKRPRRNLSGAGMGDVLGPGQAYYNKLTQAQNRSVAIQAEIAGIGKDAWNAAMQGSPSTFTTQGWAPISDYDYDRMMSFWLAQTKRLLTTASKVPLEADINDVNFLAGGTEKMIGLVKGLVPAAVAQAAEADRRDVERQLAEAGPLQSPGDTFRNTIVTDLSEKFSKGINFGIVGAVAAAAIALGLYAAFGRR